ncbi:MAG: TlyA family RNA methyltransferase [Desulfobulbaceae bacterium]|nr:TlyA family RNA methyltransferase [Desulfobulbaceae bacterium]
MKLRLDRLLQIRDLAPSRQRAQALIIAGQVYVNEQLADKAGTLFPEECRIEIKGNNCPYVSRGGLKLAGGLEHFAIDPTGQVCGDIGASTGGFSDCLLQHGAARVYAIDVGYGQLAWKLRSDSRVVVMERTNARHLTPVDLPELFDLAVIDASFISLEILLKPVMGLVRPGGGILALIKPQFEVGKGQVGKGGVVRDPELHLSAIARIEDFGGSLGLASHGHCPSNLLGPKGNREFLIYFTLPQ